MTTTKKISFERFQEQSQQVIQLVNARNMEVIVYNEQGPMARLMPFSIRKRVANLRPIEPRLNNGANPVDQGGVLALQEKTMDKIRKPKWGLNQLSISSLWRTARS